MFSVFLEAFYDYVWWGVGRSVEFCSRFSACNYETR